MNEAVVPSPCISVCKLDPDSRRCVGCARTVEQIEAWMLLDDSERMAVWSTLAQQFSIDLETALASKVGAFRARELIRANTSSR